MLGTINVWLLIGFVFAIAYLLWQNHLLGKAIRGTILVQNIALQNMDAMLMERDEQVDQKLEKLEAQMEYINEKDSKLS